MRLPNLDMALPGALTQAGRSAAEGMFALAAGLMLARLVWIAASPEAGAAISDLATAHPAAVSEESDTQADAILFTSNPFQPGAAPAPVAAMPTSLNLTLTGLRAASGDDQAGTAVILLPDGHQKRFTAGQIIVPGAVLEAVTADRVFLRVNGQLEELSRQTDAARSFAVPSSGPSSSGPAPAARAAPPASATAASADTGTAATVTPALLMSDIALQPETRGGEVSGYRVSPRGAGHFEAAGLETGDIVLRINGQSIEGMRPDMIQSSLGSGDELGLDVVRRGMIVRLRLSADSGLSQ